MGILLGLSAALAWGVGDFFAAHLSRLAGTRTAPLYTQSLGVLVSTLLVVVWSGRMPDAAPRVWLAVTALGVVHACATIWFYRALEVGKVSLTMPIVSSFAVVTVALAILSGERPERLAILGAAISLTGLLLVVSGSRGDIEVKRSTAASSQERSGVPEAIGAALCFGVTFWGMDSIEPQLGTPWLLLMLRVVTLPILCAVFFFSRHTPKVVVPREAIGVLGLCAIVVILCDTIAWVAVGVGRQSADVSIVTTLASLYSAVTICLAGLLWRERLQRRQWIGVAVILTGIGLVGIG